MPGSFDPLTLGHWDLIERALMLFDHISLVIGHNPHKKTAFSAEERLEMLSLCVGDLDRVDAMIWTGPIYELSRQMQACALVKGIRGAADLEYEAPMAYFNQHLDPQCQTIYLPTKPEFSMISSSAMRQLMNLGQDISPWVPAPVLHFIQQKGE